MVTVEFGKPYEGKICVALGYFDGMHLGHRKITEKVTEIAKKENCVPAISTFADSPNKEKTIYSYHERKRLYAECGAELCLTLYYARVHSLTGKEFFDELTGLYDVVHIVCGEDYGFGSDGCKTAELEKYCRERGIGLDIVPLYIYHGVKVSSTAVKNFLIAGDVDSARKLLSVPYHVSGDVVSGDGRGRFIGVPTINLSLPVDAMEIKYGVYGTYTEIDGKRYRSVTNVGPRPTFGQSKFAVETNLLGYDGESLLGKHAVVYFYKYIRPVRKYRTAEELIARIEKDKEWEDLC